MRRSGCSWGSVKCRHNAGWLLADSGHRMNNSRVCNCKLKIKPREKIRVCYLIFLMSEKLSKQDRDKWKDRILKLLDIDDSYYKSKYKEPVSDFPSDSNQNFAKEMEHIFR